MGRPGVQLVGLCIACCACMLPRAGAAQTLQRTPTDTFINLNSEVNASGPQLNLYTWPAQSIANAILMKFDVGGLPTGAVLDRATLYLYLVDWDSSAEATYDASAHRIINVDPDISQATGFTYDGTNPWTANSCCNNDVPMAQADIANAVDTVAVDKQLGFKSFDVSPIVRHWLVSPAENFGLLVNSDPMADADGHRYFASSEAADTGRRPYLELELSVPGSDGGGGGDGDFVGAQAAGCGAGEYYDLLDSRCRSAGEPARGCAQLPGAVPAVLLLLLGGLWRRRRA